MEQASIIERLRSIQSRAPASLAPRDFLIAGVIFAAAFIPRLIALDDSLFSGDAAAYAEQVRRANFTTRSVHFLYYVLGAISHRLLPCSLDLLMNGMSSLRKPPKMTPR